MKRYGVIALMAVTAVICGCAGERIDEAKTSESISETTAESISVTFAQTETEAPKTAVTKTEIPDSAPKLNDNQIEYRDKKVSVLMEFTGAEELGFYPKAANMPQYHEQDYVLHSYFTVENLSEKSFDFIPQKMIIYGRHNKVSWDMTPITRSGTGLAASDGYYTIEPGEKVSFNVDFIGEKNCIEYADEIKYIYESICREENVDYTKLNNVKAAKGLHLDNRIAVKKAVSSALTVQEEKKTVSVPLAPKDGEYSAATPKNSYCFTVENINGGQYMKISLRLQCLTGEAEVFDPVMFRLTDVYGNKKHPSAWRFDEELVKRLPETYEIAGVSETLYRYPSDLYIRPDGTAEYDMYFFTANDNTEDYYMFSYNGKNDVFQSIFEQKR